MLAFVKFFHIFGLLMGAAASFGHIAIGMQIRKSGGEVSPQLQAMRPFFGMLSLIGILLLWATGLWMYIGVYDGGDLGAAFMWKLVFATGLLLIVLALTWVGARVRGGKPIPTWAPRLGQLAFVMLLTTVALAVYVFN